MIDRDEDHRNEMTQILLQNIHREINIQRELTKSRERTDNAKAGYENTDCANCGKPLTVGEIDMDRCSKCHHIYHDEMEDHYGDADPECNDEDRE